MEPRLGRHDTIRRDWGSGEAYLYEMYVAAELSADDDGRGAERIGGEGCGGARGARGGAEEDGEVWGTGFLLYACMCAGENVAARERRRWNGFVQVRLRRSRFGREGRRGG